MKTSFIEWEKVTPKGIEYDYIERSLYDQLTSDKECRFWNGFLGGSCRRTYGYAGNHYGVKRITRHNPTGEKYVDNFCFYDFGYKFSENAGYREQNVIENLAKIDVGEWTKDHHLYTFYHEDGEHACTWDNMTERWVG